MTIRDLYKQEFNKGSISDGNGHYDEKYVEWLETVVFKCLHEQGMLEPVIKVQVINCSDEKFWYKDEIGKEFYVYKTRHPVEDGTTYLVRGNAIGVNLRCYLEIKDCEVIEVHE